MSDEAIASMHTDLRLLFGCVKYSKKKAELREFINQNREAFSKIDTDLYYAIVNMNNMKNLLEVEDKVELEGGKRDMCQAMDDWLAEEWEEGNKSGIITGKREGRLAAFIESIIDSLSEFDNVPESLINQLNRIEDDALLLRLVKKAARSESIDEFRLELENMT